MLSKLGRPGKAAFQMAAVSALLMIAAGCTQQGERSVRFALPAKEGSKIVPCARFEYRGPAQRAIEKAKKAGTDWYELQLSAGSLLEFGEPKESSYYYIYRGDEQQPLKFEFEGPVILLNGGPVLLDLAHEEAMAWLNHQPADRIDSIATLRLSGLPERDATALTAFKQSGVLITYEEAYPAESVDAVGSAIQATDPSGLFLRKPVGLEGLLDQSPSLTHLWWAGPRIPDLSDMAKLAFYVHEFPDEEPADIRQLSTLRQVRTLGISNSESINDYTAIGKLAALQSLILVEPERLRDLSAFSGLQNLRSLYLSECGNLTDISAIRDLKRLTHLTILPSSQIPDLSPIADLKGLEMLVVEGDDLKEREEAYDELQRKLPDTEIIGFCMGSLWILLVVPVGIFAGLAGKGRAPGKSAG